MKTGDKAPEILGTDENGREVKLSDFAGKKLVLYFYPKDNTSGCTAEACSLRDNIAALAEKGYEVIGVSINTADSHKKFIAKYDLPMLSTAGLGIAFHAKPKVKAASDQSISTIGLDGILYFLGFKDSFITQ